MRLLAPIVLFIALTTALPTPNKSGLPSDTEVETAGNDQEASTTNPTVAETSTQDAEIEPETAPQCILQKETEETRISARAPLPKDLIRIVMFGYSAQLTALLASKLHNYSKESKIGTIQTIKEKPTGVSAEIALGKNDNPEIMRKTISDYLGQHCDFHT